MSIYEYSYFYYIVYHVHIEKKVHTKKEITGKSQNFVKLLPSARPPPEIKILLVLVKIPWKTEIELSPSCAISHEN